MNALPKNDPNVAGKHPPAEHTIRRIMLPAIIFFFAGAALSAVCFSRNAWHHAADTASEAESPAALSDATVTILRHLESPVELRYYSVLDASSVPDSVQAYAGRADQLLAQYEQASGGKIKVVRCNSNASANAAEADGIHAFNLDKGNACFLGIAVVCGSQKESLPHLAPEWEQALEPDLTRAMARAVDRAVQAKPGAQPPARVAPATLVEVRRAIPNLEEVSLTEGTKVLRDAALIQFQEAAANMQAQVKEAQQRYLADKDNQSEAVQQAATEQLRKIQAEGADKLQQIALNSRAQIAALQQLKKAAP